MADRRDFDDIKLIAGADEPMKIGGIKPDDLRDLESDLMSSVDLNDDLLDDLGELSANTKRPKKKKSSSVGALLTLLVLILFGGGAGYAYLNKDVLLPLIMGNSKPVRPGPGDLPDPIAVQVPPAPNPIAAPSPVPPVTPMPAPTPDVVVPTPNIGGPAVPTIPIDPLTAPAVTTVEPPALDAGFADGLPQPDQLTNAGVPDGIKDMVDVPPSPTVKTAPVDKKTPSGGPDQPVKTLDSSPSGAGPETVAPPISGTENNNEKVGSELGDLKMPDLPNVEKSMQGGDEFLESKNALDELSDMSASRMNLSAEQKAQGLGVSVGEPQKPAPIKPVPAVAANTVGAPNTVGSATSATGVPTGAGVPQISDTEKNIVMGVNVEEQIASANRALDLERYQAAYDMFSDLYKDNARDERILMGRAVALQKLGRVDESIQAYDELLAVSPNNPDVMVNALGLVRQKNPTDALVRLMDLRQKFPTNATVAAQIGLVNAELKKYEEGIQYLNIAADLESTNPKHFFNMAVIFERMGQVDRAVDAYERTLKADALSANPKHKIDRDMIYDRLSYLRQGTPAP